MTPARACPDPEGGETQTEIKYSSTLFDAFDVELETDHTFGDGTKLTVSNSSLVPNVELKVESEMNDSKEFSHTLSAVCNKIGGPFLFFDFASLAAKYNVADKELQAEVGGHSEHTSLVIEATHSLEESSTSYSATAELRGDTCTLSMRYNPNADEAEQKVFVRVQINNTERERERDRQTDRQTDTHTHTHTHTHACI